LAKFTGQIFVFKSASFLASTNGFLKMVVWGQLFCSFKMSQAQRSSLVSEKYMCWTDAKNVFLYANISDKVDLILQFKKIFANKTHFFYKFILNADLSEKNVICFNS
jgi:hypothetical protein